MSDLVSQLRSHMDHMGHSECEASADRISALEADRKAHPIWQLDDCALTNCGKCYLCLRTRAASAEANLAARKSVMEQLALASQHHKQGRERAEAALGEAREVLTAVLEMDPGDFHWHRFKAHPEKYAYGSYAGMKGDPRSCSCEYDKAVRFLSGAPSFTAPAEPCGARVGTGEVRCDLPLGHEGYHNIVLPHILTFRHPACQRCGGARFVRVELEGVGDLNGYFMTCPTCGGSGTAEGSEERG